MTDVAFKGETVLGRAAVKSRGVVLSPRSRRLIRWAAVGVLAGVALTAGLLASLRDQALVAAESNIARVDFVLAESLERLFQSMDVLLAELAEDISATGAPGYAGSEALRGLMRQSLSGLPAVRRVMVFGPDGMPLNTSSTETGAYQSSADRSYFHVHRTKPDVGLYIGEPLQSRADGKWTFVLSRRITGADGAFLGVVGASVEFAYLEALFAAAAPEAGSRVLLLRGDNLTLLYRRPAGHGRYGQSLASRDIYRSLIGDGQIAGSGRCVSSFDGLEQVVAIRRLHRLPFAVTVAVPIDTVLESWRWLAFAIGGGVLAVAAAGAALVALLCRQIERRRACEVALAAAETELASERGRLWSVVDATLDGFWEWHLDTGLVDWSERCCLLMGLPAAGGVIHIDQMLAMIVSEDAQRYRAALQAHFDTGQPFDIETRWCCLDGGVRWLATRGRVVRDAAGRPVRMVGAHTDISVRKHLEAAD